MSDLLTHWGTFDLARRLARHDERIEPFLLDVLDEDSESARLGAVTRYGARWTGEILRASREHSSFSPRQKQKLAFALGGLLHYPADYVLKPVMSRLADADWNRAHHLAQGGHAAALQPHREISAYYDLHVFRRVYDAGHKPPFSQWLLERAPGDGGPWKRGCARPFNARCFPATRSGPT